MKRALLFLTTLVSFALLAGCNAPGPSTSGVNAPGGLAVATITPAVKNAIALCSAGISSSTALKVEALILKNGGNVSAGLSDELTGVFAKMPGVTEANAVAMQKNYMDCLQNNAAKEKAAKVNLCEAQLTCEIDTLQSLCGCRTAVNQAAVDLKLTPLAKDKALVTQCYSGKHDIRRCWNEIKDVNSARASCTVELTSASRPIPGPKAGSCIQPS